MEAGSEREGRSGAIFREPEVEAVTEEGEKVEARDPMGGELEKRR